MSFRNLLTLASVILLAGCADSPQKPADGSPDTIPIILPPDGPVGESVSAMGVNFVVQGCASRTATQCVATVPATLTFLAVLPGTPLSLIWNFGDGAGTMSGMVVSHTFTSAGTYDVSLTLSEAGGTSSESKKAFVVIEKSGAGGACGGNDDCASGSCVCNGTCPYPLADGICLQKCEIACPQTPYKTACVDLSHVGPPPHELWRTKLCLRTCVSSADCVRQGFTCRVAPGITGWQSVCLAPFPRPIGAPCRTGTGAVDPASCVGGTCLDLGASGYCTGLCKAGTCPKGARCVTFSGRSGTAVCLLVCDGKNCSSDPMLACEKPGGAGTYSFNLAGSADPPGTTYCSVKRCAAKSECGWTGTCDAAHGGFCKP